MGSLSPRRPAQVQGLTLGRALVQLLRTNRGDKRGAYVILSRLKSLQALGLLTAIPLKMLQHKLPVDLAAELAMLVRVASDTVRVHGKLFSHFAQRLKVKAASLQCGCEEFAFLTNLVEKMEGLIIASVVAVDDSAAGVSGATRST